MRLHQIITSLLEQDMYKFSMDRRFITSFQTIRQPGLLSAEIKMCFLVRR